MTGQQNAVPRHPGAERPPGTLVSVIIPTRNRPAAIVACLDALADQTMPFGAYEVVVVDDGSSPPLRLEAEHWARRYLVRVIRQNAGGPAAARHRGATGAVGEILAFTDDDCVPTAGWISSLVNALAAAPGALVGGTTVNGLPHDDCAEASQLILELAYEHFNAIAGPEMFFASNNLACRADAYHASGGFDSSYRAPAAEDREFCDRWRMQGRPLVWERRAVVVHRHSQSLTSFSRLHFRYGRGARYYHRRRHARGANMKSDLGFHRSLCERVPRVLRRYPVSRRLRLAALLVWWQLVNALGFAWEAVRPSR